MAKKKLEAQGLDPRNQAIAERMKELRLQSGEESQEMFAYTHGIGRTSYWRAESGKTNITMKLLYQVIDAHDISLSQFFAPLTDK